MFQLLKYFNKIYLIYSKLNVYICGMMWTNIILFFIFLILYDIYKELKKLNNKH